jgi:hypothetical protein
MKSKKILLGILCVIAAIFIGGLIWWNRESSIMNISSEKVSKIEIFDGGTGKEITITDSANIKQIVDNLNSVSLKKDKLSLGYIGYSFRTTIYKANGNVYKQFMINSNNTIRKAPFFYRDSSESIDYDYLKALMSDK